MPDSYPGPPSHRVQLSGRFWTQGRVVAGSCGPYICLSRRPSLTRCLLAAGSLVSFYCAGEAGGLGQDCKCLLVRKRLALGGSSGGFGCWWCNLGRRFLLPGGDDAGTLSFTLESGS